MSVAEMKLAAIKSISKLEDETAIREILEHLNRLDPEFQADVTPLEHALEIIKERSSVLEKLAR